ncbi:galactokinase [Streptacidiphilus sp. PB12-B1b]|uniref:galactokinase n=1 Tax=Streptacidiphilus sp. PB12-B1b TaxID=2705012 RepID=UPI0015F84508|nr:galactokinase [Streptacidiphilus sp. PB12-B1b]QMU79427.1 galactokinase [Streptacidiphilus sp. PB12-B1b]
MSHLDSAVKGFRSRYGADPDGVWQAPGRVNLIGEHTDYNDGFVLPLALPQATRVAAVRRDDGLLRLHSAQAAQVTEVEVARLGPGAVGGWAVYPAAVVWALGRAGHRVGGADLYVDSDVPVGAGLSSSAALECAVGLAYDDLYGLGLDRPGLALLAQRAENDFAGVPCGVMDQMASSCCTEGAALFLDTRDLSARQVPLDLAARGLVLLVVDTQVKHELADGAYAQRRAGCERAARLLGLAALRDLPYAELEAALEQLPAGELRSLTRHVVTEDARVERVVALLDGADGPESPGGPDGPGGPGGAAAGLRAVGPILTEGHASLRDDFAVSCAETDLVVAAANAAGALGARMTGGGFGGSVVVLAEEGAADGIADAVADAFAAEGWKSPRSFAAVPSAGARRLL